MDTRRTIRTPAGFIFNVLEENQRVGEEAENSRLGGGPIMASWNSVQGGEIGRKAGGQAGRQTGRQVGSDSAHRKKL